MSSLMLWLLQNGLVATAAALILMAVLRWWGPPARWEHVLWALVAVKFVLPPLVAVPFPVPEALHTPVEAVTPDRVTALEEPRLAQEPVARARDASSWPADRAPSYVLPIFLGAMWMLGAVATLCVRLLMLFRWVRARRTSPAPAALCDLVAEVAHDMGVAMPRVEMDAALTAPVISGLFRPCLYWPAGMVGAARVRARAIVAHELAHVRRGDLWLGLLELVIGCVWWWYPAWWMVRRWLRDASERACDEAVISIYPHLRRAYAEALLDVAEASVHRPSFALGLDGPGRMHRRLRAILRGEARRGRRASGIAAVVLAALVLPAWRAAPHVRGTTPAEHSHEQLVAALEHAADDPEPEVRRAAANALRDIGGARAQIVLGVLADDGDPHVRRAARAALGLETPRPNLTFRSADPTAISGAELHSVSNALSSPNADTRLLAARRLGNVRDGRAVPALIRVLQDEDFHVRQAAADALGNIGDAAAAASLHALLIDPHAHVRQSAASALGRTGGVPDVPALAAMLDDPDVHVRQNAVSALGDIGRRSRQ